MVHLEGVIEVEEALLYAFQAQLVRLGEGVLFGGTFIGAWPWLPALLFTEALDCEVLFLILLTSLPVRLAFVAVLGAQRNLLGLIILFNLCLGFRYRFFDNC